MTIFNMKIIYVPSVTFLTVVLMNVQVSCGVSLG